MCIYSGAVKTATLDPKVDYPMNATDENWTCIGEGRLGCGAMATGKVPSDKSACP
jgi:putative sterol carrier protein